LEIFKALPDAVQSRVSFLGFVSDERLGELYRRAKLFISPSRYEGFGMPAVEAMGCGVETLLNDVAAVREVTRGLANYMPPKASAPDWTDAISLLLSHPTEPSTLARIAVQIKERYSPMRVAQRLMEAVT
jgi:glycosyltransferase involved in cell wall biosynthesis